MKGHPNTIIFQESQTQLEEIIVELNERIKQLNSPYNPPQLAKDMILSIKKKKNHEQTKKINYTVLKKDGIHPDKQISLLWLIRINNFANRVNKL